MGRMYKITAGYAKGARVRLVRRNNAGSCTVEFLQDSGAYKTGERLCIAPYEIEPCNSYPLIAETYDNGYTTFTQIDDNGVTYSVQQPDGMAIWNRYVMFKNNRSNRAGGPAFVAAAKEQERIAQEGSVVNALSN